jgi:hypothetical protein
VTAYLPWWLGAIGLAVLTVSACLVARQPLGVSGILGRMVNLREELRAQRREAAVGEVDEAALMAALAAATAAEFGETAPALAASELEPAAPPPGPAPAASCPVVETPARPSVGTHALFLASIVTGALLVTLLRGAFRPGFALPASFAGLIAPGARGLAVLFAGGVLVGMGASISGGCTTGHGLTGASRLQPGSIAATVTYFGAAVAVSLLLEAAR